MKLRAKLGLTVLFGLLPIGGGLVWVQHGLHRAAFEAGVAEAVITRMAHGGRERCEADPAHFARPGRPGRHARRRPAGRGGRRARGGRGRPRDWLVPYYADLSPGVVGGPRLPGALRDGLRSGRRVVSAPAPREPGTVLYAIRMPWSEGPCAVVALRRPAPPGPPHLPVLIFVLSSLAAALAFLAGGPVVRRIRRLTRAVREAPEGAEARLELDGGDEVAELARAFDRQQKRLIEQMHALKRRDRALSEHLANTMHDVMIPLTVLEGHLMGLREADAERTPALSAAIEEAHYIATLLQNLDAWARLDVEGVAPRRLPVDMGELVERVVARHLPVARERGVELVHALPEASVRITGDEALLERAVGNLLHNALRYNARGGHVAVILEAMDDGFELVVRDDGPGMSAEEASRVMERGARGRAARSRTGRGLGLSIAARAAELHGLVLKFRHPEEGGLEAVLRTAAPVDDPRG